MHSSLGPHPSSPTSKRQDTGQDAVPPCLGLLRGHDNNKGTGAALGPGSHSRPLGKLRLRTYCVPAPVPKGPKRLFTDPLRVHGGLRTQPLNVTAGIQPPPHLLCVKGVRVGGPRRKPGERSRHLEGGKPGPERVGGWPKVTQQVWCPGAVARPTPSHPRPLPGQQPVLQGWSQRVTPP